MAEREFVMVLTLVLLSQYLENLCSVKYHTGLRASIMLVIPAKKLWVGETA